MGPAKPVELGVGGHELFSDPRVPPSRIGTTPDDPLEVGVDRHLEATCRLAKRPADVEPLQGEDGPIDGRPPTEVPIGQTHREQALSICLEQSARLEICPYSNHVSVVRLRVGQIES
jgi:hypothetical protein